MLLAAWGPSAQRLSRPGNLRLPGGGSVGIVDLNRDGKPDILTREANSVRVYLGDGRGKFEQAMGSPFAAGDNPSDLAAGDFNEDGRLDIAVANHETSQLPQLTS